MKFWVILVLYYLHEACCERQRCFNDAVHLLSRYDSLLCGRYTRKQQFLKWRVSENHYISNMMNFTSNGTSYDSLRTSDWLTEILQGISGGYKELSNLKDQPSAGYEVLTKNNMLSYFQVRSGTAKKRYYKMRLVGAFPRGWVIEQLPYANGYRIYQSTGDAYSLKAWLTTDPYTFYQDSFRLNRDIIYWENNYKRIVNNLSAAGQNINDLSTTPLFLRPWLKFVKDYNRTLIIHNLRRAWVWFGGGRVISRYHFENRYLGLLSNLTTYMQPYFNVKTKSSIWTDFIHDTWIDLFGSPNTHCYPNISYAALADSLPSLFQLQVKLIEEPEFSAISRNAKIIAKSVSYDPSNLGQCSNADATKGTLFSLIISMIISILPVFIL